VDVIRGLAVGLFVVLALWAILVAILWLHRPSRDLVTPALMLLPDLVRLVRSLLADPATPQSVKLAFWGLLAYLVNPIDLIPDFLPVIGPLDDLILAAIVLRWATRRVGAEAVRAHWSGSDRGFDLLRRVMGF
jgi:uncharacterized membrane protein YkvA (DUF1232 family)